MGTPTLLRAYLHAYDDGTVTEQAEEDKAELDVVPEMTAREIVAGTQRVAGKAKEAKRTTVEAAQQGSGEQAGEKMETE